MVANQAGEVYFAKGDDKPTLIYSAKDDIESLSLDENSNSVLVAEGDVSNLKAIPITLTIVSTDGASEKVLFSEPDSAPSAVVYVEHWDGESNTAYIRRSCTSCDGYNATLSKINNEGVESELFDPTPLVSGEAIFEISSGYSFSPNSDKALFVTATTYDESNPFGISGGIGGPQGAPYTLHVVDLASGTASQVNVFGVGDDVGDNGFFSAPRTSWALVDGEQRVVYSYLKKLFVENGTGGFDNYFETSQNAITSIYFVDSDEVLVGSSNPEGETISYYNISTQKGAIVMETLFTTSILGLTLK